MHARFRDDIGFYEVALTALLTIALAACGSDGGLQYPDSIGWDTADAVSDDVAEDPAADATDPDGGETEPSVQVTPAALVFESVGIGSADVRRLMITNLGDTPLVVTHATVEGATEFGVASGFDDAPLTIAVEGTADLYLAYTASDTEAPSGFLVLRYTASDIEGVVRVPLYLRGYGPTLRVSPDRIAFGSVDPGTHAEMSVELSNVGGGVLNIEEMFVIGGDGVVGTTAGEPPALPAALTRGQHVDVTVTFDPVDSEPVRAQLAFVSNDENAVDGTTVIEVDGRADPPCLDLSPGGDGTYEFGARGRGLTSTTVFTITNCGGSSAQAPLSVTSIYLGDGSASEFGLEEVPELPLELAPAESATFIVEFAPTTLGRIESGSLVIESNDPENPSATVAITGTGVAPECPHALATCRALDGEMEPGDHVAVAVGDTVVCTADASTDPDNDIVSADWSLRTTPPGSSVPLDVTDDGDATFVPDAAGDFNLQLVVADSRGCESSPSTAIVTAYVHGDVRVELTWTTPGDVFPDDTGFGAGTDLDLHLLHPDGCWEDLTYDCHFRSRNPNWGDSGSALDDPAIVVDDTDGWGPEIINLPSPERDAAYKVAVHYYDDHGFGPSAATVRIYVFDELVYESEPKEFPYTDFWWVVAEVAWPSAVVTPIDRVYDDVPSCP